MMSKKEEKPVWQTCLGLLALTIYRWSRVPDGITVRVGAAGVRSLLDLRGWPLS